MNATIISRHMRTHVGVRNYNCTECGAAFMHKHHLEVVRVTVRVRVKVRIRVRVRVRIRAKSELELGTGQ
eukprot:1351555-Amorphochlora_amoeboformis.AAC.1